MGIYPGTCASLDELADGATIAVPNDTTNEGRALLLLQENGLITLKDDAGLECTPNDIVDNPYNLSFVELEAAMLPQSISEVDLAVINSNYALEGGFNPVEDALVLETADTTPYPNVLAVKEGNEDNAAIQALVEALHSDTVRDYINDTYGGAVVPLF
jgi:D-methionine transport system substrate-binding protein